MLLAGNPGKHPTGPVRLGRVRDYAVVSCPSGLIQAT
jgi:hypothetical protein